VLFRSALAAPVDILAHPGLISEQEVRLAAKRGVCLEITARKGHSLTNGYVAMLARQYGASLVLNSDAHSPQDLISLEMARKIARGAGLAVPEIEAMFGNSEALIRKILRDL